MSGKTLHKWILNEQATQTNNSLFSVVIVNAEDLKDTDFACARNSDSGYSENLAFTYDSGNKSLTIHRSDDSSMNITGIRSIHFGQNGKDLNLCDPPTQFYKVKDGKAPDLSKNTV